jgi:hypothetical protein
VKLPVNVRMFPEAIAAVDAFAAALSHQSSGAAFSRAEALRCWNSLTKSRGCHALV